MAEEDEGAIGADWAMGAEGAMGSEGVMGAAIYLVLDGQDTTGIGYMALWGFGAKCWMEWSGYPLDCYDYQSTCGAKKADKRDSREKKETAYEETVKNISLLKRAIETKVFLSCA